MLGPVARATQSGLIGAIGPTAAHVDELTRYFTHCVPNGVLVGSVVPIKPLSIVVRTIFPLWRCVSTIRSRS